MGSIEVGKSADLVVIDRDIFDIPLAEVADTKALVTVFRGQTVYEAKLP
jgi:predicted amidohydrolase YtcJ